MIQVKTHFNSYAAIARALGVSGEAVRKWFERGIPAERVLAISAASGWKVTPHDLRPDLYPNPGDALPQAIPQPEAEAA